MLDKTLPVAMKIAAQTIGLDLCKANTSPNRLTLYDFQYDDTRLVDPRKTTSI
jgi:hypothetical protein